MKAGARMAEVVSQLCPNNWLPARPAQSRSVPESRLGKYVTRTKKD